MVDVASAGAAEATRTRRTSSVQNWHLDEPDEAADCYVLFVLVVNAAYIYAAWLLLLLLLRITTEYHAA